MSLHRHGGFVQARVHRYDRSVPRTKSGSAAVVAVALALLSVAAIARIAAAQVIMRPGPGVAAGPPR